MSITSSSSSSSSTVAPPKIDGKDKLFATIAGSRTITKNNETFTVYRITSSKGRTKPADSKVSICEIERRYNDFVILHQELRRKSEGIALPELPPKRFNNMSSHVIAQRKKDLQNYLNLIATLPDGHGRDTIEAFLGTSFSKRLDSDAMNPYGWANRTQQSGALATHFRRTSSNAGSIFDSCSVL